MYRNCLYNAPSDENYGTLKNIENNNNIVIKTKKPYGVYHSLGSCEYSQRRLDIILQFVNLQAIFVW